MPWSKPSATWCRAAQRRCSSSIPPASRSWYGPRATARRSARGCPASKAIQETRGLIAGLRPATLDDLGLAGALAAEAREMAEETDWVLTTEVEDPGHLTLEAEATLFRVLHEALENVRTHAAAHRVRFSLKASDDDLVAVVADDGRGFLTTDWMDMGARSGHFGLLGMRERIALLGGECRITSRPGAGTEVRIRVPLTRVRG